MTTTRFVAVHFSCLVYIPVALYLSRETSNPTLTRSHRRALGRLPTHSSTCASPQLAALFGGGRRRGYLLQLPLGHCVLGGTMLMPSREESEHGAATSVGIQMWRRGKKTKSCRQCSTADGRSKLSFHSKLAATHQLEDISCCIKQEKCK
jgi:hypothetical protein